MSEGGEEGEEAGEIFQRKGREQKKREKLSCRKRRETPHIYMDRELWSQLEVPKKK